MKLNKINDIKIKPIKNINNIDLPVKGSNLFPEIYGLYGNIFLLAKKRSGKSTVIYNIIKNCVGKKSKVYIFCSTCGKDKTYESIMDYLENRDIYFESYNSIIEDDINNLSQIIEDLKNDSNEEDNEPEPNQPKKPKGIFDVEEVQEKKKREYKPKYIAPENIFIFDDLGATLQNPALEQLLKTNRHYKSKVIISSQYIHDLRPASILNLDFCLIFKGMPVEKLEKMHKLLDLSTEFDKFNEMYDLATEKPFNFLYIDIRGEKFRINFDVEIIN